MITRPVVRHILCTLLAVTLYRKHHAKEISMQTYEVQVSLFNPVAFKDIYKVNATERYEAVKTVLQDYSANTLQYLNTVNVKPVKE